MSVLQVIDFVREHWDKILLVITTAWTIWQDLRDKLRK